MDFLFDSKPAERILIIAPHPDDEVLGCGGTIKKSAERGAKIHVCFVTKSYSPDWSNAFRKKREKEIEQVKRVLGFQESFLDLPTAKLDTIPQKRLSDLFSEMIKEVNPDTLFLPWKGDCHQDHRAVFKAGLVASKLNFQKRKNLHRIISYEILSETEWSSLYDRFSPDLFVDISKTIEEKISALKAYKTEVQDFPYPRSEQGIKALAHRRGSEVNLEYAEAFCTIKEIYGK